MQKQYFDDSTLYFSTKGRAKQVRIYSKLSELLDKNECRREVLDAARDKIRFELIFRKPAVIQTVARRFSNGDTKAANLLRKKVSDSIFDKLFLELRVADIQLSQNKTRLQRLLENFRCPKAMQLNSFNELVNLYGPQFYRIEQLGV